MIINPPEYLYKILSEENWNASNKIKRIQIPPEDEPFIHLATEMQLNKIISKFWADNLNFFILKLTTDKLIGKLVLEANPGGANKYYHLYEGIIPLDAVVEARRFEKPR